VITPEDSEFAERRDDLARIVAGERQDRIVRAGRPGQAFPDPLVENGGKGGFCLAAIKDAGARIDMASTA